MSKSKGSAAPTHLQVRHARIREQLLASRFDGILLTCAADLGYATGVPLEDNIAVLTHDQLWTVTDSRYEAEVSQKIPWLPARIIKGKETLADAVAQSLANARVERVAFEANFLTFGQKKRLDEALDGRKSRRKKPRLKPSDNLMVNVRKVKDGHEIDTIRRAVACAEDAYKLVRADLKVGMTENEVAGRLEYEMRRHGATGAAFGTNISSGLASAMPHYRPGNAAVQDDAALLFDWGAVIDGYCSDITRTHGFGSVDPKVREIYRIVLEAQLAAIATIRPGITTRAVDKAARKIITKAGYGKQFGHGLGHGIGLAIHELPRLSRIAPPEPLQPGMIVTVEPGIYLPGLAGVRIEDDVLVTDAGCEVLTSLDKSYEGCHLE